MSVLLLWFHEGFYQPLRLFFHFEILPTEVSLITGSVHWERTWAQVAQPLFSLGSLDVQRICPQACSLPNRERAMASLEAFTLSALS